MAEDPPWAATPSGAAAPETCSAVAPGDVVAAVLVPDGVALASVVVVDSFCAPSKGSSVSVSSAGTDNFVPVEPPSCKGVARTSPVSSSALRSSFGSTRSLDAISRGVATGLFSTFVAEGGVSPRSTSGSINSSSRPSLEAGAEGAGRASAWTELSRAGRTGTPASRGSSTGRSVRGSSIGRDAAFYTTCLSCNVRARVPKRWLTDRRTGSVPRDRRLSRVPKGLQMSRGRLPERASVGTDPAELQLCSRSCSGLKKVFPPLAQKQHLSPRRSPGHPSHFDVSG